VMHTKETWFIFLSDGDRIGIGECGILRGLSTDDRPDYEEKLRWTCEHIHLGLDALWNELMEFPSIQFGLEMAFMSLQSEHLFELFSSEFTKGKASIPINGLIWMGDAAFMKQQIQAKLSEGFRCLKLKIGAIDFQTELDILKSIRQHFRESDIEIRVDANGAFSISDALEKLKRLSDYQLHSIEQPIKAGQIQEMAQLCSQTPLPIALDEELIGVFDISNKEHILKTIQPQYIILKPSFVGGLKGSQEWITLAKQQQIDYWVTSALESNVGLNAIAQWTFTLNNPLPQGLGTGGLFTNNFECPLHVKNGTLHHHSNLNWKFNLL